MREAVVVDGLLEERGSGHFVALFGQHEINGVAELVDGTVQVDPFSFDLNVRVSKLKEPPLQLLAELSVILSHHSAPIIQPRAYSRVPSVEKDKAFALQSSPTDASPDDDAP
jgi:hypothetical protein